MVLNPLRHEISLLNPISDDLNTTRFDKEHTKLFEKVLEKFGIFSKEFEESLDAATQAEREIYKERWEEYKNQRDMKVEELRKKLKKNDGELFVDNVRINLESDDAIHFSANDDRFHLIAYINKNSDDDDDEVSDRICSMPGTIKNLPMFVKIAAFIGHDLPDLITTVEKEIVKPDLDKFIYQGKVEAYEKLQDLEE